MVAGTLALPPHLRPPGNRLLAPPVRRAHTSSPRLLHSALRGTSTPPPQSSPDADLGELGTYPLRHASAICKANGGGRWEPKPVNLQFRIPGDKEPHEIELEREEEERRIRRLNPVIVNGDFQLRVPREFEPRSIGGPFTYSTF
ncbi:hypothetical protein NLI96_g9177 [Meripilus lineatus]|uniref:Uncharacterized protein n=1 Tax=Meripilus lineatus TaxID=2056292 RepID=A0AAD5V0M9_9APHY|nr:hypothetical protein NLI96_g9177 [Physisporinus lineatus]